MAQPDFSPSAERNKHPILEVLQTFLPAQGTALEIASGTGQHVVWLAQHLPDRAAMVFSEIQNYAKNPEFSTSSGWRLNAWMRSVQALQEKPLQGHGVGNWAPVVKRIQGSDADAIFGQGNHSNPHNEYLLWAVELGVGGALLLLVLLIGIARDALRFPPVIQQALLGVVAAAAACPARSRGWLHRHR